MLRLESLRERTNWRLCLPIVPALFCSLVKMIPGSWRLFVGLLVGPRLSFFPLASFPSTTTSLITGLAGLLILGFFSCPTILNTGFDWLWEEFHKITTFLKQFFKQDFKNVFVFVHKYVDFISLNSL